MQRSSGLLTQAIKSVAQINSVAGGAGGSLLKQIVAISTLDAPVDP